MTKLPDLVMKQPGPLRSLPIMFQRPMPHLGCDHTGLDLERVQCHGGLGTCVLCGWQWWYCVDYAGRYYDRKCEHVLTDDEWHERWRMIDAEMTYLDAHPEALNGVAAMSSPGLSGDPYWIAITG